MVKLVFLVLLQGLWLVIFGCSLGEKPYACKKCGTAYADKKNMDAHVFREHLKMKPLECPEPNCAAKFWRHDRFAHHCRKIHGFDPIVREKTP